MTRRNGFWRCLLLLIWVLAVGGTEESLKSAATRRVISVTNVDGLYAAITDASNIGARIELAPGYYVLDPAQPNQGRLELQQDMDLVGQANAPEAVVIEAANLPLGSFIPNASGPTTGAVRLGRGSNSIESMTVQNVVNGVAAIETDLATTSRLSTIRIANVIAQGNQRGIDLRNRGTGFNNRVLRAFIEDNVLRNNVLGEGQGIRFINTAGVTGASVDATLRRNHAYGNFTGCLAETLSSSGNTILIDSADDFFTDNGVGCSLAAGAGGSAVANDNVLTFAADNDDIERNDQSLGLNPFGGGIVVFGGEVMTLLNGASGNVAHVETRQTRFMHNQDVEVRAFGAFSTAGVQPGTHNRVELRLGFVGRSFDPAVIPSQPPDATGTNQVFVLPPED
jgi:hypothetical protein